MGNEEYLRGKQREVSSQQQGKGHVKNKGKGHLNYSISQHAVSLYMCNILVKNIHFVIDVLQ